MRQRRRCFYFTAQKKCRSTALYISARRDSNPRPSPWQGDTPPLSHSRTERVMGIEPTYLAWKASVLPLNYTRIYHVIPNAQSRNRTSDTRIFSPLLYRLSYLGRNWMEVDSNHRSNLQQIYSLSPLATRESIHMVLTLINYIINPGELQALFQLFCKFKK